MDSFNSLASVTNCKIMSSSYAPISDLVVFSCFQTALHDRASFLTIFTQNVSDYAMLRRSFRHLSVGNPKRRKSRLRFVIMKFDVSMLKYLTGTDFRVLVGIELGMKNHELVPLDLIIQLSGLSASVASRGLTNIHKHKLVFHSRQKCDGYRLTCLGYDFLALKALVARGVITCIGRQVGVGKESDVYEVTDANNRPMVLKLHRLGRVSFRAIKEKRDYMGKRKSASWIYMSRLAATREYAYMQALHKHEFPVPEPIDCNRHCVVMSMLPGTLMNNIRELANPDRVYKDLVQLITRLSEFGLIHGDFNEFNLLCDEAENVYLIDFPQMISSAHPNAVEQFERDATCVRLFFERRFKFDVNEIPEFLDNSEKLYPLDEELNASGFTKIKAQNRYSDDDSNYDEDSSSANESLDEEQSQGSTSTVSEL